MLKTRMVGAQYKCLQAPEKKVLLEKDLMIMRMGVNCAEMLQGVKQFFNGQRHIVKLTS